MTDDHLIDSPLSSAAAAWISRTRIGSPASSSTVVTISSTGIGRSRTPRGIAGAVAALASSLRCNSDSLPRPSFALRPGEAGSLASRGKPGFPRVPPSSLRGSVGRVPRPRMSVAATGVRCTDMSRGLTPPIRERPLFRAPAKTAGAVPLDRRRFRACVRSPTMCHCFRNVP